jgi:hypothetical protein
MKKKDYNKYDWLISGWEKYWTWRSRKAGRRLYANNANLTKAILYKETGVGTNLGVNGEIMKLTRGEVDILRGVFSNPLDKPIYDMNWGLMDLVWPLTDPIQDIGAGIRFMNAKYMQQLNRDLGNGKPTDDKSVWIDTLRNFGPGPSAKDYDPFYAQVIWNLYETGMYGNSVYVWGAPPKGFNRW